MMALLREKLGLNWSGWALISPKGARCVRCDYPHFFRRWHEVNKSVQTKCANCDLLNTEYPSQLPQEGE